MDAIFVGVDYGNGNTKGDTGFVMPSGVKMLATKPPIETKTLSWNGQHFAVGAPKMEIQKSKLDNEDMLISTMATIGEKFKNLGITSGEIRLGVGLPLTMMGKEKRDCHDYYMKNRKLNFRYEGVNYSVYIISVDVFPQGYCRAELDVSERAGGLHPGGGCRGNGVHPGFLTDSPTGAKKVDSG